MPRARPQASVAAASAGKAQYLLPPRRVVCSYVPGNYTLYRGQTFDVVNATKALGLGPVTSFRFKGWNLNKADYKGLLNSLL
jgi:hypothetical protein